MTGRNISSRFRDLAEKTIARCFIPKETEYCGRSSRRAVFLPAGDEKYRSFWPVDAIFSSRCGLMESAVLAEVIDIIFTHGQNADTVQKLANGLEVPPFAIADHINFDGKPVYFPGTYASGEAQGDGSYGFLPPLNNLYLVTELVERYITQSGDRAVLEKEYHGMPLKLCLEKAFEAPYALDEETQLCCGSAERRVVDWTYCDQVEKTGLFLVPSIMRAEAAKILADFFPEKKLHYLELQQNIVDGVIRHLFDSETGWFYSATGVGHQFDVWGTAYAIYSDLLPDDIQQLACKAILRAYDEGTACCGGYVRHILTQADHSDQSAWESTMCAYNHYMNGGYWATPSGWFYYALAQCDPSAAEAFLKEFMLFQEKNQEDGAPYEWFHPQNGTRQGRYYGTSGTSVYAALRRTAQQRGVD